MASRAKRDWPTCPNLLSFQLIGWESDGKSWGSYSVSSLPGTTTQTDDFLATADCDIDGDSTGAVFNANRAEKYSMISANNIY